MTGPAFKTVSQCYSEQCPSSRGAGKEEPPGALYPQGQTKLRLGRRQVWLRERGFLDHLCFSTIPNRRERSSLWVCPVCVSCFAWSKRIMKTMPWMRASGGIKDL